MTAQDMFVMTLSTRKYMQQTASGLGECCSQFAFWKPLNETGYEVEIGEYLGRDGNGEGMKKMSKDIGERTWD
jgi:hypothetical protein